MSDSTVDGSAPSSTPAPVSPKRRRARARWTAFGAATVLMGIALVLLFFLAQATDHSHLYERYFTVLLTLNVAVAAFLGLTIGWGMWRLWRRWKSGKFGTLLLVKLAAIFALVGVAPGVLIYGVSYLFVSRSIESWFDARVEGALDSGLTLARTSLETQAREFGARLRAAAQGLADASDTQAALSLEQLRERLDASELTLWGNDGRPIASAGGAQFELAPRRPGSALQRQLRAKDVATSIEGLDEAAAAPADAPPPAVHIHALAMVDAHTIGLTGREPRLLHAVQPMPVSLVRRALEMQLAYNEYQERALGSRGLRRMYIGTLTLSLFLAVFGAELLAALLGRQLARPLLTLADGMRQVAAGDLRPKPEMQGRDELDGLTRSFAEMTRQLADARGALSGALSDVDAARAHLQTILDNLTAGVIVLSDAGIIISSNPGAARILRTTQEALYGRRLQNIPDAHAFAAQVQTAFESFAAESEGAPHWERQIALFDAPGGGVLAGSVTLLARGAALPGGRRLLVFDDISDVVSAQRVQAWGEVARRLAHEIKNPLTPIQLSAERLEFKLEDKLEGADRALLVKSVHTIVDQVAAMQRLVNEFRDYARLPAARLAPLQLNDLIAETMHLYISASVPVAAECDSACPPIMGDAQQLQQVIHNLVQNAQDATEQAKASDGAAQAGVIIRTQWLPEAQRVRMSVIDHGPGFSPDLLKRIFEPYVTTKAKGTGLGLPVVKKIASEHGARIDVGNRTAEDGSTLGAQVTLTFEAAPPEATAALHV